MSSSSSNTSYQRKIHEVLDGEPNESMSDLSLFTSTKIEEEN